MGLKEYNKKRDFKKTAEPTGKLKSSPSKNLYIIQKHAASHLHYDFRLELNGVLLSWAIPKGPCLDPSVKRLAMHTEDHPVAYGSFQGIIPKGEYGGGTVMLWDKGDWKSLDPDPTQAHNKGHLRFILKGKKLKGRWSLIKLKKDDDKSWFLIKAKDEYAKALDEYDITQEKSNSVLKNESLDEITENYKNIWTHEGLKKQKSKKKKVISKKKSALNIKIDLKKSTMPRIISPQLATLVSEPPLGENWVHEVKFDGYRILAFIDNKKIKMLSRNGKNWTNKFNNVENELIKLPIKKAIFDGEIVLLDKNSKSDFQLLQNAIDDNETQAFVYYIFDILYYNQFNLTSLPLLERKNILRKVLDEDESVLRFSDHVQGSGKEIFKKSCELGLEGIISKDINSTYILGKRSKSWLKVKCVKRQELLIGGYTKPQGARGYLGSLFLGYYDDEGNLVFCGNVGTGFTAASLKSLYKLLQENRSNKNPFSNNPPGYTTALWVKPKLMCEVEFTDWTTDGSLRHPSFKGLRNDKKPKEIRRDLPVVTKVITKTKKRITTAKKSFPTFRLTNPTKILYPEDKITKLELANYYEEISDWILPYITNRPLTIVRCPENYHQCFYQKHINKSTPPSLHGITIKTKSSIEECIYINNLEGLMALVQLGSLEIHPWGSTIKNIDYPDMITFDLDPAPEVKWQKVVETAFLIKEHLEEFKLKSFVKTTGGKGLHIVIPIQPEYDWNQIKNFAHVFVKFLVANYEGFVSEMSKAKRKNKIFIDYLRNQRGSTSVAAYSTRARAHAPVSTPLAWDELTKNFKDTSFNIITLPQRLSLLKNDPWKDFFKIKQSLRLDKLK